MRSLRATRILELNPEHSAVKALIAAYDAGDKEKAAKLSKILASEAELIAGVEIEDAGEFVELVSELF
jgi:HSP90 family molecular chaperone